MIDKQQQKLTPFGQFIMLAFVIAGVVTALVIRSSLGYTGALWGGVFGAAGGGLGALIGTGVAYLCKQWK